MEQKTHSTEETQAVARGFTKRVVGHPSMRKTAVVVALKGELGSGKTTFVQGVAKAVGVVEPVLSPTFLIVKSYPIPESGKTLYHIDCYRLKDAQELVDLGWQEIVQTPSNIVLVEWPERVQDILPKDTVYIFFETVTENQRTITLPDS